MGRANAGDKLLTLKGIRFSITTRSNPSIRRAIEAIADDAWVPIPYCDDVPAVVAAGV